MSRKWLVLDAMGVIFEVGDDTNDLLVPYVQQRNSTISAEIINDLYVKASLGEISSRSLWDDVGLGNQYIEIEKNYLETCLTMDPEFKPVAEELGKTYSIALLCNDVKEWSAYLRRKYDINRLFSVIIISGEVGYRKPDERIYRLLLDRLQAPPSDCVFVDDRAKNLKAASSLGIKTIRFCREADASADGFSFDDEITSFAELPAAIKLCLKDP